MEPSSTLFFGRGVGPSCAPPTSSTLDDGALDVAFHLVQVVSNARLESGNEELLTRKLVELSFRKSQTILDLRFTMPPRCP